MRIETDKTEHSIFVEDLCKHFEGFSLDHLSFSVPKGCIVGFIGENGAGKSTTIRLILRELQKDMGRIVLLGKEEEDARQKEDLGVVFDTCNFHEFFTARDLGKIFSGVYHRWDPSLYQEYLKRFQVPEKKPIGSLSKGMQMKLSIICALAHHPKLLILDEATTGLDPVVRDEILELFLEFIQDEEHSIFFSSHITSDIQKIADYVILIHQGKLIFQEQKDDLLYHYGIIRCGEEAFSHISKEDYLICRKTRVSRECLVRDRERIKKKYKDIVVDAATLEEIMLFYVKGGDPCED